MPDQIDILLAIPHFAALILTGVIALRAFLDERYFTFFFSGFVMIYIQVRPTLIYFDLYFRFRPLYYQNYLPENYWQLNALIALSSLLMVAVNSKIFRKMDKKAWINWNRQSETGVQSLAFVITACVSLPILEYASYYFCLSYLLCYRLKFASFVVAIALVSYFILTTIDRRHFVAVLIFLYLAFTLWPESSNLRKRAKSLSPLKRILGIVSILCGMFAIALISIYMRSPSNLQDMKSPKLFASIVEMQLDFAHVSDELNNIASVTVQEPWEIRSFALMYLKTIYLPVPRSIWLDKPETISREVAKSFNYQFYQAGGSLPATLLGDIIYSFGFFFPVFIFVTIFLIRYLVKLMPNLQFGMGYLAFLSFFLVRGPFDAFTLCLICPALFQILWFSLRGGSRRRRLS